MLSKLTCAALVAVFFVAPSALTIFGQTSQPASTVELSPARAIERAITSFETHHYTIKFGKDDFTQVSVEQKGINLKLTLWDEQRNVVATMDGLNEATGPEILSFTAIRKQTYLLEISAVSPVAGNGAYTIHRTSSRKATQTDKRRVDVERVFVEGIKARDFGQIDLALLKLEEAERGWAELKDDYLRGLTATAVKFINAGKANAEYTQAMALLNQGGIEPYRAAKEKFQSVSKLLGQLVSELKKSSVLSWNEFATLHSQINALIWAGYTADLIGDTTAALELFDQARILSQESRIQSLEASSLSYMASVYTKLGNKQMSLKFHNEAKALFQSTGDRDGEAAQFVNIATVHFNFGEKQAALDHYTQGVELYKTINKPGGQAIALSLLGSVYEQSGELQKALVHFEQSLALYETAGNIGGEVTTLIRMGNLFDKLGERQKALDYYRRALPLYKSISNKPVTIHNSLGDLSGEAQKLLNIGAMYQSLGENQTALDFIEQAFPLYQAIGNKLGQANALNKMGEIHLELGEKTKALNFHVQALALMEAIGDKDGQAASLHNMGSVNQALSNRQEADENFKQALPLFIAVGNKLGQASTLNNFGSSYLMMGNKEKALELYTQALEALKEIDHKSGQAASLSNIASVYLELGEKQKALDYQNQVLPLLQATGKDAEVRLLSKTGFIWSSLDNPRMAIFYYKEAVNHLQGLRKGLDNEIHRTFLRSSKSYYQDLVEKLIDEDQLDQAIQVLNLYQDQQFFDLDRDPEASIGTLALSPREKRYKAELEKAGQIGARVEEFKRRIGNRQPTAEETSTIARVHAEMKISADKYLAVLSSAAKEFAEPPDSQDVVPPAPEVEQLKTALLVLSRETGQNTVALYTLSDAYQFFLLVVSPAGVKAFSTPVTAGELEQKVLRFYTLLQTSTHDPRILGQELYNIILKPARKELQKQKVQTLLWSLDGTLRYIPMAALWDGEGYLVKHYQTVQFTRADPKRMTGQVSSTWKGVGFGSSQELRIGGSLLMPGNSFSSLPGVTLELDYLFGSDVGAKPMLQGSVFMDKQFTRTSFYEAMKNRPAVVHVSSHFKFSPGNDWDSYLVLGDATYLSMLDIKASPRLFDGVELLTLSACNTAATQAAADGKEVDGFAELAQRLGANAVMASLWQVSDCSTPWLMRDFYAAKLNENGVTKAEALRTAQLALLTGATQADCGYEVKKSGIASNVTVVVMPESPNQIKEARGELMYISEKEAPYFKHDPRKPFAHPYFWSPFVLYGNWR